MDRNEDDQIYDQFVFKRYLVIIVNKKTYNIFRVDNLCETFCDFYQLETAHKIILSDTK